MSNYSDGLKALLGSDLQALWICNESTGNLADDTGNGWEMTVTGGASITYQTAGPTINGESHYAVQFPGAPTSRFRAAGTFPGASATTGRTYGTWVYLPGTTTTYEEPLTRSASGESEIRLMCDADGDGACYAYQSDGTTLIGAPWTPDIQGGVWLLLLGWWNPSDQDVYVQRDNATPISVNGTTNINTTSTAMVTIGATQDGGNGVRNGGRVALAFVVDRVLTSEERATLYSGEFTTPQIILPDADVQTTGWTATPLWSKLSDDDDATYITATAS